MKQPFSSLLNALPVSALLSCGLPAGAITFTNDTAISFNNTNYDGADLVVTNCTLTVDGLHSFANLQVLNAGNLTHSFGPSGVLENRRTITNEQQVLSVTNAATLSNANVTVSTILVQDLLGLVTYTNDVDYLLGLDTNGMTTILLTTNSAISESSTNLVSYDVLDAPVAAGLSLTVTGDVFVAQGGRINVDGKGYDGALGPGAGRSSGNPMSGSGAGHGGYGGQSAALDGTGTAYDVLAQPTLLGSGGGRGYGGVGGAGGGSVKLVVGGNLRIEGAISANGANGINNRSGGGSGGSIWLTCQSLYGAGVLSANGGAGEPSDGGGGAGGRISLQFAASTFSGLTPARGGNGFTRGGAGTVYTRANSQLTGQVLVDNGGRTGASTPLSASEVFDLTAQGGGIIYPADSQSFGNLLVAANAWISLSNQPVTINVTGNATIQAGGGITANAAGFPGGQGQGAGSYSPQGYTYTGGGGGYGGYGAAGGAGAYGGLSYGGVNFPGTVGATPGSGGGCYPPYGLGGAGGGAITLLVTGVLRLDGTISADGGAGLAEGSGGGSGGGIWLSVGTLAGAGSISANGGTGNGFGSTGGGGGGGGRISLYSGLNLFFGVTSARGGSGSAWGGAGTVYTLANNQSYGQLLVDNGGQSGTNTTWTQLGPIDLTVKGGAVVTPPSSQTIGTLLVASNGWVSIANQVLTVTGNATIQVGGGILADGTGNAAGVGSGAGRYVSTSSGYIGGGGGYGGYGAAGGAPAGYSAYGGITYGSLTTPTDLGSGGGNYTTFAKGGAGGGAIRLNVTGVLQVDGRISAAGGPAITPSAGGGSGGTISLTVGTLSGSGIIAANGGAGNYLGGGGGGGRIAIVYGGYAFAGSLTAYGGGGYAYGGAGTIYTTRTPFVGGEIVVDNGGQAGTNTALIGAPSSVSLIVKNGGVLVPMSYQPIGSLLVASNGWVVPPNGQTGSSLLTVSGNATVQAGGGIITDGMGYAGGLGTGAGKYYSTSYEYIGGGGGYGGYGASGGGTTSAYGGITYGSVTAPVDLGSGGGGNNSSQTPPAAGGAGGGAIRLSVTGTLQVDGRISARGLAGAGPSAGGGSGGSLNLTVGTLAGSGSIDASGGVGNALGGGGGGGRIAITYSVNTFAGLMSAGGGGGYARGGAGTVYTKASNQNGLVVVDNGGQAGTNTSWSSTGVLDLTVKGGAILSLPNSSITIGNLLVGSNGWVATTIPGVGYYTLTVTGNATIQAGGGIIADATGNDSDAGGAGPSPGSYISTPNGYVSGGGGYGGCGATSGGNPAARGGNAFGNLTVLTYGSNGGGFRSGFVSGLGGGLIALNVTGTLDVDGRISATGGAGVSANAGGGSGGGINLTVGTLSGSGIIAANGGAGNGLGGGGGGGRIAIIYAVNAFSGLVSAYGGGGYAWGGAGTIYTKANSQSWGQVLVDNGGQTGTNTSWASTGTIDLTVTGAAVVSPPPGTQTFGNLLVASNGWLSVSNQILAVTSNATIRAGGGIIADGAGYPGGQGPGAGKSYSTSYDYIGGGGGYGGYGASGGGTTLAYGGATYGSVTSPTDFGSGGGSGYIIITSGLSLMGGAGGGAIRLTVGGTLQVDGEVSARGQAGTGPSAGGGSGGSINLSVGALAGSGFISADGGAGNALGGGGGGGRIAVSYKAGSTFSGRISAYGGSGYATGGAGTIFFPTSTNTSGIYGIVEVDNGGQTGTNTSWSGLGSLSDLTVSGGAVVTPSGSQSIHNLTVSSNGWVVIASGQGSVPTLTVSGNATVQAGGGIIADGTGYGAGQGPGLGSYTSTSIGYVSGGGGNGGYGATSGGTSAARGGSTVGFVTIPGAGSGGGGNSSSITGGSGGGAFALTVTGTLQVDGRLSAAGGAGASANAGGGAGGGINLNVGTLAGSGVIAANGGAGNGLGGGGGGGRIAIIYTANAFSGLLSAYGGGGYAWGGAGTIYTKASRSSWGQLLVDNGGQLGANTTWYYNGITLDLVAKGGAVVIPPIGQPVGNLLVASNGWIIPGAPGSGLNDNMVLTLNVTSNATVQAGGGIIADGLGNASGTGRGAGKYSYSAASGYVGGGAGYGGYGAASGGTSPGLGGGTYGTVTAPTDAGSGGGGYLSTSPGGAGAGAIHMSVSGALLVNGRISANGNAGVGQGAGGGSGGGIWLSAGTLAGAGTISANGGAGNELGGGGGGGCISLQYGVNAFEGTLSAYGGGGYAWGGAGTIYTKANSQAMGQMLVDNGGHAGTNTPVAYLAPFDLTVRGGAIASPSSAYLIPSSGYLILSNLTINSGGTLACFKHQTNLDVTVLRNATIDAGGMVSVDGEGFAQGSGFGAGRWSNGIGSGGGYGGNGGASSLLPGGGIYGSAQQPVDLGSSGGLGWGLWTGGGEGGGAVRLTVGGALTVNGRLSAGGNAASQDDGGGGSGGSIWLTAGALVGNGAIAADGGAGELYDGGGGGGGRIAIYTPLNVFSGQVSAAGGPGLFPGQSGSIYYATLPAAPQVVSCSPTGVLNAAVSSLDLVFSTVVNPASVSAADFVLTAPGSVMVSNLTVAALSPYSFRVYFPGQTAQGNYAINVGPQIMDLYGQPLSQVYTGAFSIVWSLVQGTVTDTNGLPVAGVVLQPDGGIASTTTDTNGNYQLSLPPGGTIVVTPSATNLVFVPSARTYVNVTGTVSNENYLAVSTIIPAVAVQVQSNSCVLSWSGIAGVTYQPVYSTNLVDWLPYGNALPGTNGPIQFVMPIDTAPQLFFRVGASY